MTGAPILNLVRTIKTGRGSGPALKLSARSGHAPLSEQQGHDSAAERQLRRWP
jgi:hypothetical protein